MIFWLGSIMIETAQSRMRNSEAWLPVGLHRSFKEAF